jgi:hypothetical protein
MEDKKRFLKALRQHRGIVTHAAEQVNISRMTHYNWMKLDEKYKAEVDEINDATIDHVESKLFESIDGAYYEQATEHGIMRLQDKPSVTAAIFYLKTKAKHRGYVERQEITGADGSPFQIIIPKEV